MARILIAPTFDSLSPMVAPGDIIYGGVAGHALALSIGGANTVLHGGGSAPSYSAVVEADITLAANTTNNVNTTRHGFVPVLSNNANTFFDGVGTYTAVTEAGLSLSDVATDNVTTLRHGFIPTLSNLTTQFFRGDGAWAAPASTTQPNAYTSESFAYTANVAHNIVHNFGTYPVVQAFDTSGNMVIPLNVQNLDVNTVAMTFTATDTFVVILTIGSPPLTAYTTTAGDYTMLAGDYLIEETGSGKIVTLLTPVGRSGKTIIIKNTSAGICDVQTAAGTIDGIADVTLASFDSLTVVSNGTDWLVV